MRAPREHGEHGDPAAERAAWDVARLMVGLRSLRRAVELAAHVAAHDHADEHRVGAVADRAA